MSQAAEDDLDDPDDPDDADDPAVAIDPHTWRKLAGRYNPQRQQQRRMAQQPQRAQRWRRCYSNGRRTSAGAGGVASIMRRFFHAAPAGPASIFQPFPPRRRLFLYIL